MDYSPLSQSVGVLGGGQLAKMLHQESMGLDVKLHFLDPDPNCPVSSVSPDFRIGDFSSYDDVISFGSDLKILTIEIENVNTKALFELREKGVSVFPQPEVISMIKDKGDQKLFLRNNDFPTAGFFLAEGISEILEMLASGTLSYPFVQKLRVGGYDGKGVSIVRSEDDLHKLLEGPSVIEEMAPIWKEISVIAVRSSQGESVAYPSVEMEFHPEANLVDYLLCPATIGADVEERASTLALRLADSIGIVGLLAVEMFVLSDGTIWINEMAPRPHNSGHHTLNNGSVSQFENHIRSITGLPLGTTRGFAPSMMLNVVGDDNASGKPVYPEFEHLLKEEGVFVYLYGKKQVRPFRKMGHVCVVAETMEACREKAFRIRPYLKVKSS